MFAAKMALDKGAMQVKTTVCTMASRSIDRLSSPADVEDVSNLPGQVSHTRASLKRDRDVSVEDEKDDIQFATRKFELHKRFHILPLAKVNAQLLHEHEEFEMGAEEISRRARTPLRSNRR